MAAILESSSISTTQIESSSSSLAASSSSPSPTSFSPSSSTPSSSSSLSSTLDTLTENDFKDIIAFVGEKIEDFGEFGRVFEKIYKYLEWTHKDLRPVRSLKAYQTLLDNLKMHKERLETLSEEKRKSVDDDDDLRKLEEMENFLKERGVFLERLEEEVRDIHAFLLECAIPDSEYEVIKQDVEWKTTMKKDMGSSLTKTFRVEGNIPATIPDVCAVLSEVDLFPTWVPKWGNIGLQEVREVARLTKASALVYAYLGLPWPLAPRYMNLFAFGSEVLEEGLNYFVIVMKSVEEFPGYEIPTVNGVIGLELAGGCLIKPISPTQTTVKFIFRTDPKISYLPYSLINWGMKKFAHFAFTMLGNHAKNLKGTPYEKRMETNVELYGDLQGRMRRYFERKEAEKKQKEEEEAGSKSENGKQQALQDPEHTKSRWAKFAPWGFI